MKPDADALRSTLVARLKQPRARGCEINELKKAISIAGGTLASKRSGFNAIRADPIRVVEELEQAISKLQRLKLVEHATCHQPSGSLARVNAFAAEPVPLRKQDAEHAMGLQLAVNSKRDVVFLGNRIMAHPLV